MDDHRVVRDGLSSMFARDPEFEVLGEAAEGAEAVRLAQELRPDVILMDLRMPGMDGVTAITELARRAVAARVSWAPDRTGQIGHPGHSALTAKIPRRKSGPG